MVENTGHKADVERISVQKMNLTVTHRRPQYSKNDREKMKEEIERQLFDVFRKYADPHH